MARTATHEVLEASAFHMSHLLLDFLRERDNNSLYTLIGFELLWRRTDGCAFGFDPQASAVTMIQHLSPRSFSLGCAVVAGDPYKPTFWINLIAKTS